MVLVLTTLLTACVNVSPSPSGLCDGLAPLVDNHVDALLIDGGPKSTLTGDKLVAGFDGGCNLVK